MRWFNKQRLNSLWVCGFSLVLFLMVLCCQAFAEDEAVMVKRIVEAHEKALKVYKVDHDLFAAIKIMDVSGVDQILKNKPKIMKDNEYISILNDYGFFLSMSSFESDINKSIKYLRIVITKSPKRTPAYLNLGDILLKKMKFVFNFSEKVKIAKEIENCYQIYKQNSKKNIGRIDQYLNHNMAKSNQSNICDYILDNVNNDSFDQIIAIPSNDIDRPSKCDIENDGKSEDIYITDVMTSNSGWMQIIQFKKDNNEWINIESMKYENINNDTSISKYNIEDDYFNIAVIPYSDGVYYIRYCPNNGYRLAGPYMAYVSKLDSNINKCVCVFDWDRNEIINTCSDENLCRYVLDNKKINYSYNSKLIKIIKKFKTDDLRNATYKLFKYNDAYYFNVEILDNYFPFHEIWRIENGKKRIICSFSYLIKHRIL